MWDTNETWDTSLWRRDTLCLSRHGLLNKCVWEGKRMWCGKKLRNLVAHELSSFFLSSLKEQEIPQICGLRSFNSTPHLWKPSLMVVTQCEDQTVLTLIMGLEMMSCSKAVWPNSSPNVSCLMFWREKSIPLPTIHECSYCGLRAVDSHVT